MSRDAWVVMPKSLIPHEALNRTFVVSVGARKLGVDHRERLITGGQLAGLLDLRFNPAHHALESRGEDACGRRSLYDGDRHAVEAGRRPARGLHRGCLHRRQTGIDALDRGVGAVDVDFDDEFELIVGHARSSELIRSSFHEVAER